MTRLATGFLLGVIVTITVVFLLGGKPREMQESPIDRSTLPQDMADVGQRRPAITIDKATERDHKEFDISMSSEPASNADPLAQQAGTIDASQPGTNTTNPSTRSSVSTANEDYPPEIAAMIKKSVNKELQERYESDKREESWATYMEGQLANYFAQKPELAQFNFSLIDCRTSICEIHVLGYGPDALMLWNVGTADIVTQTWHDFRSMSVDHNNPQPDILAIILILSRKPPD